jgi:hypothetical protein
MKKMSEENEPGRRRENPGERADGQEKPVERPSGSRYPEKRTDGGNVARDESAHGAQERIYQLLRARKVRRAKIAAGCFFGMIAVIYVAVAVYFGTHFYEGTVIYGIDCSQMTSEEAKEAVSEKLEDYTLTLQERQGGQETISARAIELKFVDNGSIDRVLGAQRSYVWPVMMLINQSSQANVSFTYSQEKVEKVLSQMDCFNELLTVSPQDAYIGTAEHGFEVVPEVQGTTLDEKKALNAVLAALDRGDVTLSFDEEDCYLAPTVYQDDEELNRDAASMNELVQADITYDFGDRTETLDVSVLRDWIVKLADGSFAIDDTKVEEYVASLAEKYDTFGMSRDFYTSYGTVVSLTGGDYGWAIDQNATTIALHQALEEGYRGVMEPEYVYTAMSRETNDIGYTYVEICISQQRMFCYKDGVAIVDTPIVTGNPNKGNATPSGSVWAVDAKMRNYVLVGEDYRSPVDYWIPFNGNIGIHDMQTRSAFGGTIYLSNGSHGCINTPYDQVAQIYEAVSIGTPVIVYDNP